jgi:hypothetical protein
MSNRKVAMFCQTCRNLRLNKGDFRKRTTEILATLVPFFSQKFFVRIELDFLFVVKINLCGKFNSFCVIERHSAHIL